MIEVGRHGWVWRSIYGYFQQVLYFRRRGASHPLRRKADETNVTAARAVLPSLPQVRSRDPPPYSPCPRHNFPPPCLPRSRRTRLMTNVDVELLPPIWPTRRTPARFNGVAVSGAGAGGSRRGADKARPVILFLSSVAYAGDCSVLRRWESRGNRRGGGLDRRWT